MRPTVRVDNATLWEAEARLGELSDKAPQAISRALNRAVTNIASNISKEVRAEYNIKAADIKTTLDKENSTRANLSAIVRSRGNLIPLDRFKISPKKPTPKRKSPIRVSVKKGPAKAIKRAFVVDLHGIKVFRRVNKKRLPIDRLFGPSIPQMIANEDVVAKINQEGQEMFRRRLDHEINRILERGGSR